MKLIYQGLGVVALLSTAGVLPALSLKPPPPEGPFGGLRTPVPDKYPAVYINEKFYGHAGEFNNSSQKLMLPVGEYSVRVEPAGGAPINQKVKIEDGKTVLVH